MVSRGTTPPRPWARARGGFALLGLAACSSLDGYSTGGDAAYCGELVAASFVSSGLLPDGFTGSTPAELEIDVGALSTVPGQLWTRDEETGLCAPEPLFDGARLRAVEPVLHDAIATLDFGEGRDHNFFVWVDSTCLGSMLGVVSLMRNKRVELRLFKPAPVSSQATAAERPGFGVLVFERREQGCES